MKKIIRLLNNKTKKKYTKIHIETVPKIPQPQQVFSNVKYKKEFSDILFKMLKQGYTVKDFCNEIGIYRSKFYRWLKLHPDFRKVLIESREAAKEIWRLRCTIPFHNLETGKRLPNTSYHRLLASNIYGRDFLPPNKKLSKEAYQMEKLKRILFEYGKYNVFCCFTTLTCVR